MTQYIVAYDEENFKSPTSVYEVEDSMGDIFKTEDNSNIREFFDALFQMKSGQDKMPKGSLVMVTENDLEELMNKYPADKDVADLSASVMEAIDTYPDAVFYYTFE